MVGGGRLPTMHPPDAEERTGRPNVARELDWLHNRDGSQKSKRKGERPKATHERPMMHERACARVGVVGSPLAHARHDAFASGRLRLICHQSGW